MNKFRIVERDGEYKVQKLMEPIHLHTEYVKEKISRTWFGKPVYGTKANKIYGDASWIDWFGMDESGDVYDIEPPSNLVDFCLRPTWCASFEDKEAAISYIEYYYGQKYTLEEAEWRVV